MAKQTINIGASPNDGTGTPLRTSFDYCNLNFTELYTAVGPSGNNIVVPGTATITGDLGVGTASPSTKLEVATATANTRLRINSTSVVATEYFRSGTGLWLVGSDSTNAFKIARGSNFGGSADYFSIGSATAECTWFDAAGGTRMTLNATGLGVGRTPSYRFQASSGTKATTASVATVGGVTTTDIDDFGIFFRIKTDATAANRYAAISSFDNGSGNGPRDLVLQDLGGNVGIGVTPSAWSSMIALQVRGASLACDATIHRGRLLTNAVYDGAGYKYIQTNFASMYLQNSADGAQSWYTAPSGTAGNAITFTQALTLDASGNLLVTKTSYGLGVGFAATSTGSIDSVMASALGAQSTLNVYSTGAAAYRFYVSMNGTINATNTSISAISDARLKENVQDIDVGLGAILALKPRKFDWKAGKGKDIKGDRGFIAQEFEQVFPNLVDEWKDEAPEGEAPYKSVRQDLIPVLVKAIQELTARVQTLEAR